MYPGDMLLQAREAFHRGAYGEVRALLDQLAPSPAQADLALRTALRQRDYATVAAAATQYENLAENDDERAIAQAYRALAAASCGENVPELTLSRLPTSAVAKAEVAFVRAMLAWINKQPQHVERLLRNDPPQTLEQQVRRISILAWSAASNGNYRRQAELLLNALTRALNGDLDAGALVSLGHPLAVLLRELELGDLNAHAEATLLRVPWTEVALPDCHNGLRALAWRFALHGNYQRALTFLEQAAHIAPNTLALAVSYSDKARVAWAVDATEHMSLATQMAFEHFERVDWAHSTHEEPLGFYGAADILARDVERARTLFATIDDTQITPALGAAHGDRVTAYRAYAQAMFTDGEQSLDAARRAYRIFKANNYIFRAASAALRAFDVSHDRTWLERVEPLAERYPDSLLAHEIMNRIGRRRGVTGRRLQVLRSLCNGRTIVQTGAELHMSPNTVRNHIRRLHQIFGVERRAELVRKALEENYAA